MAIFRGDLRSQVLAMDTGLQVILPYDYPPGENQTEPCKVLYLLHGLGDNAAAWCRYTAIESHARQKGVAVIMPEVQRSFYYDMAYGLNYFTYLTVELPALCARMFHISTRREDTFVAGLSMGGYGAMKCAFIRPELYAGCASFSGSLDMEKVMAEHSSDKFTDEFKAVLGENLAMSEQDNLIYLAKQIAARPREKRPSVFITCGTGDFLLHINRGFSKYLNTLPLEHTYREWEGKHDWVFWDESVRQALDFFDL